MLRSIVTVLRGNLFAQVIGVAILPILSRHFAPTAFGNFQAFQAIITFLLILVTLRYEIAVLRADDDRELAAILALCGCSAIATTLVVSAALALAEFAGWPQLVVDLQFPWWLLSLSMLVGGAAQLLGYVVVRAHRFGVASNSKVGQAVANASTSVVLAVTVPVSSGLIFGDFAGRLANTLWLARATMPAIRAALAVKTREMRVAAFKFRDLSIISLPSTLINIAGPSLTPLLIYAEFDAATAGQFGLTERTAGLPVALIVAAVSQVHMAHLATDLRVGGDAARRNFRRVAMLLAAIATVPTILAVLFAVPIFRLVLGSGWDEAAHFAQVLAPSYLLALVTGGINMTLTVVGRQKAQFAWGGARFVAMTALWLLAPRLGWPVAAIVAWHSAILSFFSILMLIISYRALPSDRRAGISEDELALRSTAPPIDFAAASARDIGPR